VARTPVRRRGATRSAPGKSPPRGTPPTGSDGLSSTPLSLLWNRKFTSSVAVTVAALEPLIDRCDGGCGGAPRGGSEGTRSLVISLITRDADMRTLAQRPRGSYCQPARPRQRRLCHSMIKPVSADLEGITFSTAIGSICWTAGSGSTCCDAAAPRLDLEKGQDWGRWLAPSVQGAMEEAAEVAFNNLLLLGLDVDEVEARHGCSLSPATFTATSCPQKPVEVRLIPSFSFARVVGCLAGRSASQNSLSCPCRVNPACAHPGSARAIQRG
jgi:hypothetical protein